VAATVHTVFEDWHLLFLELSEDSLIMDLQRKIKSYCTCQGIKTHAKEVFQDRKKAKAYTKNYIDLFYLLHCLNDIKL